MVLKVHLIARLQMTGLSIEEIAHTHTLHIVVKKNIELVIAPLPVQTTVLGIVPLHRRNLTDLNCTIATEKIADTCTCIRSTVGRDTVL